MICAWSQSEATRSCSLFLIHLHPTLFWLVQSMSSSSPVLHSLHAAASGAALAHRAASLAHLDLTLSPSFHSIPFSSLSALFFFLCPDFTPPPLFPSMSCASVPSHPIRKRHGHHGSLATAPQGGVEVGGERKGKRGGDKEEARGRWSWDVYLTLAALCIYSTVCVCACVNK